MMLQKAVQQRATEAHARIDLLFECGRRKKFSRGTVITGEGLSEWYPLIYVQKGLVRHASGLALERTYWLTAEGEFAVLSSAGEAGHTACTLVAEEAVEALVFTADALEAACARHYAVGRFHRLLVDTQYIQQAFHAFVIGRPPLERCIHFRRYFPEWVQRVPHALIGDFLQIEPSELEALCAASMSAASLDLRGMPEPVFAYPWEKEHPGPC